MAFFDVYATRIPRLENVGPLVSFIDDELFCARSLSCGDKLNHKLIDRVAQVLLPGAGVSNGAGRTMSPEEVRGLIPVNELVVEEKRLWDVRGGIIDEYGVSSLQNHDMLRVGDYLGRIAKVAEFLRRRGGGLVSVVHGASINHKFRSADGKLIMLPERNDEVVIPGGVISSARVRGVDRGTRTYTGEISWGDIVEDCYPTSKFVAHTVPEVVGFKGTKGLLVRDVRLNPLTGAYDFTRIEDTNNAFSEYILSLIEKTDKLLAEVKA